MIREKPYPQEEKMKRIQIHQWRNWLLDYICDDKYELIQRESLSVHTIVATDPMDAENQCRQIISNVKAEGLDQQ